MIASWLASFDERLSTARSFWPAERLQLLSAAITWYSPPPCATSQAGTPRAAPTAATSPTFTTGLPEILRTIQLRIVQHEGRRSERAALPAGRLSLQDGNRP